MDVGFSHAAWFGSTSHRPSYCFFMFFTTLMRLVGSIDFLMRDIKGFIEQLCGLHAIPLPDTSLQPTLACLVVCCLVEQ